MRVCDVRKMMLGREIIDICKLNKECNGYEYEYFGLNKNFKDTLTDNLEVLFIEPHSLCTFQIKKLNETGEYDEAQEGLLKEIDSYLVIHIA